MISQVEIKEIETAIRLNKDEVHLLHEIVLFAIDYNIENHRFTEEEENFSKQLEKTLDAIENLKIGG